MPGATPPILPSSAVLTATVVHKLVIDGVRRREILQHSVDVGDQELSVMAAQAECGASSYKRKVYSKPIGGLWLEAS